MTAHTKKIAQEVAMIMPRISRRIFFDILQDLDIPHAQLFVLVHLSHQGPCHISDIIKEMNVSAPTVSGIIDRLEKGGYVRRVEDKVDRRAVIVELTAKGGKVAAQLGDTVVERWADLLKKISSDDAEKYIEILRKIKEAL